MANLEQFVNVVRQAYLQGSFNDVIQVIKKNLDILSKNANHIDNVLETFNVENHSLAVMACLSAKLATNPSPSKEAFEVLMTQLSVFITNCNQAQIRAAQNSFGEICHALTLLVIAQKCPIRGIELLRRAIVKVQKSPDQLTSIHADFCQLCLMAHCFKPALAILNVDITHITANWEQSNFDVKHLLLYYYYGGMIYAAMKKYDEALYMLEVVVTTPARAVSHIMLEAYKKYILVSLILHGKLLPLPKWTSQVVNRFIKPNSNAYNELANACQMQSTELGRALNIRNEAANQSQMNSIEVARLVLNKYESLFRKEKNLGLANQVLASLYKNNIQRLTKTFLTLSLADVAARVQLASVDEAEKHIFNMIEDGEIFATVNKKDGMVVFHDDPEKYTSPTMLKKLEDEVTRCIELDRKIRLMEEDITVNPVFLHKCTSQDEDSSKHCPYSM